MKIPFLFALLLFATACGSNKTAPAEDARQSGAVGAESLRMRHQILFQNGDDKEVFEGYMIRLNDSYVVKAFVGPGVDLFTVARAGERHKETLHISALADRIDVSKIGADIFRVYMDECSKPLPQRGGVPIQCERHGERVVESYDASGNLIERRFPDAYGIGLQIRYLDFHSMKGHLLPIRIELRWGNADRLMVIHTASIEFSKDIDASVIEGFLK